MEVTETIQCPYCGQSFELAVDTSTTSQKFTVDCEVCCRPMEVFAECEPGEILNLEVRGGYEAKKTLTPGAKHRLQSAQDLGHLGSSDQNVQIRHQ